MTPVGSGLYADRAPLPLEAFPPPHQASYHSLWDDSRANLFQDPRAAKVGDILTVKIRINDKATSTTRRAGNAMRRSGSAPATKRR